MEYLVSKFSICHVCSLPACLVTQTYTEAERLFFMDQVRRSCFKSCKLPKAASFCPPCQTSWWLQLALHSPFPRTFPARNAPHLFDLGLCCSLPLCRRLNHSCKLAPSIRQVPAGVGLIAELIKLGNSSAATEDVCGIFCEIVNTTLQEYDGG